MFKVTPIPAFNDNYHWLIHMTDDKRAYIVDPGDHVPVIKVVDELGLSLEAILITHQHYDHVDGIIPLLEHYQSDSHSIPVYGPDSPKIPQITHPLYDQNSICLFDHIHFRVIASPGHTPEHIVYFSDNAADTPILFSGDTLFAAGCGRLLAGGRADDHYRSLAHIAQLAENTRVYCAHEYTLANIEFALAVEPHNQALQLRKMSVQADREQGRPTIPTTIGIEKATNPFIRLHTDTVAGAVRSHWGEDYQEPSECFAALRRWKDQF